MVDSSFSLVTVDPDPPNALLVGLTWDMATVVIVNDDERRPHHLSTEALNLHHLLTETPPTSGT
jgi:hypothetical protein